MRKILFRGKRLYKDEWIEGCYIHIADSIHFIYTGEFELVQGKIHTGPGFLVFGDTVGQYTGLTDKNGTKIFEGDILKFSSGNYVVEWLNEHSKFLQVDGQFTRELYVCINESEVIGNIYDDPELLGGGNNA